MRPRPCSPLFPYTTLFRSRPGRREAAVPLSLGDVEPEPGRLPLHVPGTAGRVALLLPVADGRRHAVFPVVGADRKSTRLNSSHMSISYAVFCLKKKTTRSS